MFNLFRKRQSSASESSPMARLDQVKICSLGNKADRSCAAGDFQQSFELYEQVIETMKTERVIDAYYLGKAVLGELLVYIRKGDIEKGFELWTKNDGSTHAVGIVSLEQASQQFHGADSTLYRMVSAYYHACARDQNSVEAIIQHMNAVTSYVIRQNPQLAQAAANHWYGNFFILSGFEPPRQFQGILKQIYSKFPKADENGINCLVERFPNGQGVSFNQREYGLRYFPIPQIWEGFQGEAAAVFHPDDSVTAS